MKGVINGNSTHSQNCLGTEDIAAFIDGKTTDRELEIVVEHLNRCAHRYDLYAASSISACPCPSTQKP